MLTVGDLRGCSAGCGGGGAGRLDDELDRWPDSSLVLITGLGCPQDLPSRGTLGPKEEPEILPEVVPC